VIYLQFVKVARLAGYHITLFFIWQDNMQLEKRPVAERVKKGGHNIAPDTIERRYEKGMENFQKYAASADYWYVYDDSGTAFELLAKSAEPRPGTDNPKCVLQLPRLIMQTMAKISP
jgi:predicted ABC-type ATPase